MERYGVYAVSDLAAKKEKLFDRSKKRYAVYAMLAGVFCGLGMILAYSAAGNLYAYEATRGMTTIVFGITFALSFTLIVFSGSELFTGNVMVLSMSAMNRTLTVKKTVQILLFCYFANFCGATLVALLIGATGLLDNEVVGAYLVTQAQAKMQLPFFQAVTRGILCNMLVCLATWSTAKMKSETSRMIMLVWCVYGFCTCGFEHSIANMALFVMAACSGFADGAITVTGYFSNIIPVTIGNIIGGALIVAGAYYFVGNDKNIQMEEG